MVDANTSIDVLAFRLEKIRRAPRNWATWICLFTFSNGVLIFIQSDIIFLGGLVAPFLIGGWWPHVGAAATALLLARAVPGSMWGPYTVLSLYALDTVLSAIMGLWAGVFMHLLLLAMCGMARLGQAGLERLHREALEREAARASAVGAEA